MANYRQSMNRDEKRNKKWTKGQDTSRADRIMNVKRRGKTWEGECIQHRDISRVLDCHSRPTLGPPSKRFETTFSTICMSLRQLRRRCIYVDV